MGRLLLNTRGSSDPTVMAMRVAFRLGRGGDIRHKGWFKIAKVSDEEVRRWIDLDGYASTADLGSEGIADSLKRIHLAGGIYPHCLPTAFEHSVIC